MNEVYTLWFQDGGGRETLTGRAKLREMAKRYDFDADEVIETGSTEIITVGEDGYLGDCVGGVFREENAIDPSEPVSTTEVRRRIEKEIKFTKEFWEKRT